MKTMNFVCTNCQTAAKWAVPINPVVFGCSNCNEVYQIDTSGALSPQPALPYSISGVKPDWFLPGAQVNIDGILYTIISVYNNGVNWEEWNSEDGWETGYDEYREWFLVAENGEELWLEENDNSSYLNINTETPVTQEHIDQVNSATDNPYTSRERGSYSLLAFQGIDDDPLDKSTWNYRVVQDRLGNVSVEWQTYAPSSQWRAFRIKGSVRRLELERGRLRSDEELEELSANTNNLGFFKDLFALTAVVMFVLAVWSFISGQHSAVFQNSWNFSAYKPAIVNTDSSGENRYVRELGTVRLNDGVAYRFNTACTFNDSNAGVDFSISILKMPEGTPVNAVGATFFKESGTDDEGAWTESTLSDYFQFTVNEPGEYLIEAQVTPQSDFPSGKSGTLTVSILPVVLSRYFIIFFLTVVLSWLILQWKWEYQAFQSKTTTSGWLLSLFGK